MQVDAAMVFVDWDSARRTSKHVQRLLSDPNDRRRVERSAIEIGVAIDVLQRAVANLIGHTDSVVRVVWRIYHGWHRGETASSDRLSFEKFISSYDSLKIGRLSFGRDFTFGDQLLCQSSRSPLRYTLRERQDGNFEQKMVDTALVADLLHAARTKSYKYLIVIGDDDDLLPGGLTVERWGGWIHFLRIHNTTSLPLLRDRAKGFPLSVIAQSGEYS